MKHETHGAPEGGALPLVLGGCGRDAEQLLGDVAPFFDLARVAPLAARHAAYVIVIVFALVGLTHIACTVAGAAG